MKKLIVILVSLLVFLPQVSLAKTAPKKKVVAPAPVIAEKECQYLTAYQPSPDSNPEYKPGVDVHGKPVVEADITPPVIQAPEKYSFDITVDTARYIGLSVPTGVLGEARIGTITVEKGQVKFNGNPIEGDAEAALKALCTPQKPEKQAK